MKRVTQNDVEECSITLYTKESKYVKDTVKLHKSLLPLASQYNETVSEDLLLNQVCVIYILLTSSHGSVPAAL